MPFSRQLFHFEFPEGGGGEPIALDGREPAPAAPEAPAEPTWAGPSQDEWTQLQQQNAQIAEFIQSQQAPPPPQPGQQVPQLDPFSEDYAERLAQFLDQRLGDRLAPYQQWQEQQQLGEAEERALDILEDDISRNGDFLDNAKALENARALANVYYAEEAGRMGEGAQAAEAALQRAASTIREYEKAVGEAAISRHLNQLKTLNGAPGEPGSTFSQGAQELVTGDYRQGGSVANRIFGSG